MTATTALRTFAVLAALGACATSRPNPRPIDANEVQSLLDAQRAAWDRGDLDTFMATYWHDDGLTFVGASGLTRGYDATLARYRTAYPDAAARGTLAFELLEVRDLGAGDAALVIGRWHLTRATPAQGTFTLVVERRDGALRIVHDHSSSDS